MLNNMPNHPNWIGQPMRSPANCSFSRARANAVNTKMWRFWLMKFISSRLSSGIGKTSWPRSYVTSALTSNVPLETKLKILIKIPKSVLEAFSCEDDHNAPVLGKLEVHKIVGTKEKRGKCEPVKESISPLCCYCSGWAKQFGQTCFPTNLNHAMKVMRIHRTETKESMVVPCLVYLPAKLFRYPPRILRKIIISAKFHFLYEWLKCTATVRE